MTDSLDNLFKVLSSDLSPELIAPDVLQTLRRNASLLPPIYHGGLECRLGQNAAQVDLFQCIYSEQNEPEILKNHIFSSRSLKDPAWMRVGEFCDQWSRRSSPLNTCISNIWLEFDLCDPSNQTLIPSIFFPFKRKDSQGHSRKIMEEAAETVLDIFMNGKMSDLLRDNLYKCSDFCPDGARITNIGIMLARDLNMVRIIIQGIDCAELTNYLLQIKWQGSFSELEKIISQLYYLVDYIVLSLDVGEEVYPKIGLECYIDRKRNYNSRWKKFLDYLVEDGLCSTAKRTALLAWPGYTEPVISSDYWPDDLIIESLLRSSKQFTLFVRHLNHIKIVCEPQRPKEAKVYLWFSNEWQKLERKHSLHFNKETIE